MFICENKVYSVLSENVACCNYRFFCIKIILKLYPCKVCDKLHVCMSGVMCQVSDVRCKVSGVRCHIQPNSIVTNKQNLFNVSHIVVKHG